MVVGQQPRDGSGPGCRMKTGQPLAGQLSERGRAAQTAPPSKLAMLASSARANARGLLCIWKETHRNGSCPSEFACSLGQRGCGRCHSQRFHRQFGFLVPGRTLRVRQQPRGLQLLTRLLDIPAWSLQRSQLGGRSHTNPLGLTLQDEQWHFLCQGKGTRKSISSIGRWRRLCLRTLKCYRV